MYILYIIIYKYIILYIIYIIIINYNNCNYNASLVS